MAKSKNHISNMEEAIKVPAFTNESGFYASERSSLILKKVKAKNTKPELKLRKALWALGIRYRLSSVKLLGKPDLIFIKKKIVVFVDGDFWHGYNWTERKPTLKTNTAYWIPKIERNIQRDKEVNRKLAENGWKVIRFWEHQIAKDLQSCIDLLLCELQTLK